MPFQLRAVTNGSYLLFDGRTGRPLVWEPQRRALGDGKLLLGFSSGEFGSISDVWILGTSQGSLL